MKNKISLKILIILVIIAISLISFVGFYAKDKGLMVNLLPEYMLSMNLDGSREVIIKVSDDTKEVVYDSEGNVSEEGYDEEGKLKEGYTKADEKINKDEVLTESNYVNAKEILDERLQNLGVEDYIIRQDISTGAITINLPEDSNTDKIIGNLTYRGKFEILDSETEEVLMTNNDIKESKTAYSNTENGTAVALSIEFNKEGKKKLEEITRTYVATKDDEGKETIKKIKINLDDQQLLETYFAETLTSGVLPLTVGNITTDSEEIASYAEQATQIASVITDNKMEIQYEIESNTYLTSVIGQKELEIIILYIASIVLIALIVLSIRFRLNGILASCSYIGFAALLLITLRYTNVIISLEGIIGIITILIVNYTFVNCLLTKIKKNKEQSFNEIIKESFMSYIWILLPLLLISIVFTFITYTPVASIGMIMFWGIVIILAYNYVITRTLLKK